MIPVEVPIGEGPDFHGIINLFTKKAHLYKQGSKSADYDEVDIPAELQPVFDKYYEQLIETIAATDDGLLERYLEGGEITRDDALRAMKEAMKRMELFPLFCVSSDLMYGTKAVLSTVVELMPSAWEMEELHAFKGAEGDHTVEIHAKDDAPFAALVFKTMSEPHVGEVSLFRIFSGKVETGVEVFNATRDGAEKLGHLSVVAGKGSNRGAGAVRWRHRLCGQAPEHAYQRHALHAPASGTAAADRVPGRGARDGRPRGRPRR